MTAGSVALRLIVISVLHSLVVCSQERLQNEYDLDYPKKIGGSKMWCYRRQLTLQTETTRRKECRNYPCRGTVEGLCRNCSYQNTETKKRVYMRAIMALEQPIASEYQNFSSPGYPTNYPSNVECVWLFKVPGRRRRRLTVEFHDLHLAGHATDCADNVRIRFISRRKNPTKTNSTVNRRILETRLCGSSTPVHYKKTRLAHVVEIVFMADSIHSSRGFNAVFRGFKTITTLEEKRNGSIEGNMDNSNNVSKIGKIVCSKGLTNGSIPLAFQAVLARIQNTTSSKTEFQVVSSVNQLNKTDALLTANYISLVNATRLYEKYKLRNGRCDIEDQLLQGIVDRVQIVRWPAKLWESATVPSIIQDEIEENTTSSGSLITAE